MELSSVQTELVKMEGDAKAGAEPQTANVSKMRVEKRSGRLEAVDLNKILRAVERCCHGLDAVDPMRVATRTISGLYDGASTEELDRLSIQTSAALTAEEPQYSKLAARLLATYIGKEVRSSDVHSFSQSVKASYKAGLISETTYQFVRANKRKLNDSIDNLRSDRFNFFGIRTVYDRYLLKDPKSRRVLETPQYFFMRVACGLAQNPREALEFYNLLSSLEYLTSSPTLFNAGTTHSQLSSCYLLDSPHDDLVKIYDRYADIAKLSKYAGGIGLAYHRIRSSGSLIKSTNGLSQGVVPWLKTLDSSVAAVNQGGRRKGACCVYLEPWHGDIEQFLELRDNTGDHARRTHNLNLANWIPDLFMERVRDDAMWSLFDPKEVPELCDTFGEAFRKVYLQAETEGRYTKQVKARDLYLRMMRTLAQTGNGWMTFKDSSNEKCNQTGDGGDGRVVHSSNLCTEIIEVTSEGETAVCNLGSINLGRFVKNGKVDYDRLSETAKTAVKYLDRVIDINFYPTPEAKASNERWRPIGLGLMGLQDVFFKLRLPFDSEEAAEISARIQEEIYYAALERSVELAEELGAHEAFHQTKAAKGVFQFELWGATPQVPERFETLRERMMKSGLRNSLMIAIAPTATIASISGCYECIEPQVSNLFKRETLSGDFLQINNYLVSDLKKMGMWNEEMRQKIKAGDGSIQHIEELPEEMRVLYRTAWELPQKTLIEMAASRGAFIDQSQSLNLFMETPTIGKLSSMYMYAWERGIKTTYYLRSRPATRIKQTSTAGSGDGAMGTNGQGPIMAAAAKTPGDLAAMAVEPAEEKKEYSEEEVIACSLENPEYCEACQ